MALAAGVVTLSAPLARQAARRPASKRESPSRSSCRSRTTARRRAPISTCCSARLRGPLAERRHPGARPARTPRRHHRSPAAISPRRRRAPPRQPSRSACALAARHSTACSAASRTGRARTRCSRPANRSSPPPSRSALSRIARAARPASVQDVESFKAAEAFLRKVLEKPFPLVEDEPHVGAARGLESLARLNRKIATLDDDDDRATANRCADARSAAREPAAERPGGAHRGAPRRCRHARGRARAAGPRGSPAGDAGAGWLRIGHRRRRTASATSARRLSDTSYMVRLEAVRALDAAAASRTHGCQPLLDALSDQSLHVVLASLGCARRCLPRRRVDHDAGWRRRRARRARSGRGSARCTRSCLWPSAIASARRSACSAFAMHQTWQVRMYAARAAAIVEDVAVLTRLASDPDDNVAEAALPPLRRLIGRRQRSLVRRCAEPPHTDRRNGKRCGRTRSSAPQRWRSRTRRRRRRSSTALAGALERITAEQCETSRDTRLALIERTGAARVAGAGRRR